MCVVARAHHESDSATGAGTNRCPQGVPKMSQIRSVGSGNVLLNANHLTLYELMPLFLLRFPLAFLLRKSDKPELSVTWIAPWSLL